MIVSDRSSAVRSITSGPIPADVHIELAQKQCSSSQSSDNGGDGGLRGVEVIAGFGVVGTAATAAAAVAAAVDASTTDGILSLLD